MKNIFVIFFLLLFCLTANGQSSEDILAQKYYRDGEYIKAAEIYAKLYKERPTAFVIFRRYIEALKGAEQYEKAIGVIKSDLAKQPYRLEDNILLGLIYEEMGNQAEANKYYDFAIGQLQGRENYTSVLAYHFGTYGKSDYAIKSYEIASSITSDKSVFADHIAELYHLTGDRAKMLDYYALAIPKWKKNIRGFTGRLDRNLEDEDIVEFQKRIFAQLKKDNPDPTYNKVLIWTYLRNDDFKRAFRQARLLDRQLGTNGQYIYELSNMALNYEKYEDAIKGYLYIQNLKDSPYLQDVLYQKMYAHYQLLEQNKINDEDNLNALTNEFKSYVKDYKIDNLSVETYLLYADYEAMYRHRVDTAITILNDVVDNKRLQSRRLAKAKINLADYLLIKGDRWESTLLYSQVDKMMKESPQGEEARFKNAMLSYYMGDFEWATEQFDVLKRATSKLISNDAIDMSVFITDHLTTDTIDVPLKMFAKSDLLIFQNKYEEAENVLDDVAKKYPQNRLIDDILYRKANMLKDRKKYEESIELYEKILEKYSSEIKADNALFEMAEIYERYLDDESKAQELYKQLFLDFDTSTLAVEARKRYRQIREK